MGRKLGDLSAEWESNGDPGSISPPDSAWKDGGGISYGAYQFASNYGVPQEFIRFAQGKGYKYADALAIAGKPGSDQFSNEWKKVASLDPEGFSDMQHQFTKEQYYDAAAREMRELGIDPDKRSDALRQVIWSRKVQYDKNFPELIVTAAAKAGQPLTGISDADLIKNIYEVTLTEPEWTSGAPDYREGLFNRFRGERDTALKWLEEEQRPPPDLAMLCANGTGSSRPAYFDY
jgi:hypothetical protein